MEQWKRVIYDGITYDYEVSTKGNVRNMKTGYILQPFKPRKDYNYLAVHLHGKNIRVRTLTIHRLVATAFIPNPDNLPEVDHIDRNPLNNCVENLRWVSHPVNMDNTGKRVRCVETGEIFDTMSQASREKNVDISNLWKCLQGKMKSTGGFHWEFVEEK